MLDPLHHLGRPGDESADGSEGLRERPHHEIDIVFHSEMAAGAAPPLSDDADAVGVVEEKASLVPAASFDDARQIGDIAAHAVDAVDDYEAAFPARDPLEDGVQVAGVVVLKTYGLSVGELGAVVDAGVVR